MVVFFGKKIQTDKPLYLSLIKVYGIGYGESYEICSCLGISNFAPYNLLSKYKKAKLWKLLQKIVLGLPRLHEKLGYINKLKENKSYKGFRHFKNLSVRGQRTKTNGKTRRKGIF